ncbi:MAG: hypothetical protein WA919_28050 [Coleofasciculaceae cyanobacterium]
MMLFLKSHFGKGNSLLTYRILSSWHRLLNLALKLSMGVRSPLEIYFDQDAHEYRQLPVAVLSLKVHEWA